MENQKTVYGLAVERAGKEKQRKLLAERVSEARAKIDQARLRRKGAQERLEGLREEAEEKEERGPQPQGPHPGHREEYRGLRGQYHGRGRPHPDNEAAIQRAETGIVSLEEGQAEAQKELDAITDDIVRELDARLKESGYSAKERQAAEEAIDGLIAAVHARLAGKQALLEDLGRLADYHAEDARSLIEKARADLAVSTDQVEELSGRYEAYRRTTPSFIDEFLSPEGIITKKRAVDARIARIKDEHRRAPGPHPDGAGREPPARAAHRRIPPDPGGASGQPHPDADPGPGGRGGPDPPRREIAVQEGVLKELENEVYLEEKRLADATEQLSDLDEEIAEIETKGRRLTAELEKLERDIALKNSDLGKRQEVLRKKMDQLGRCQSELERIHLNLAQTDTEIRNIKENFREAYSRDLMEFEERMFEIRVPVQDLRDRLADLRTKLKDLGSVNLMAPEEFAEVKERYDFLSGQLADLEKAREDLKRITEEIRTESAELFLDTYNKIKKNFHNMFRRLFGGGRGELRLVDPDHVLESGIEIYAQPPGKKLEVISLLSGGEKSLTAIALLFATYMVRPSPFCFLDEIDAALDEQNVIRFVNLLREFGRISQFIVITHNKKTVIGADALLGVTMEESGVTKVIAVRLERGDEDRQAEPEMAIDLEDEDVEYESGRELAPDGAS